MPHKLGKFPTTLVIRHTFSIELLHNLRMGYKSNLSCLQS